MRQIEQQMLDAVCGKLDWRSGDTSVWLRAVVQRDGNPLWFSEVFLHSNHIATFWHDNGQLEVNRDTLIQWPTATTQSRLRALGARVETRKGVVYLNGEAL